VVIRFGGYPAAATGWVKDRYADSLAYVDSQIKRLVDHLAATGMLERTALVITGDTGQAFLEHGCVAHAGPVFEEVMRVPLIIRAPGLDPQARNAVCQHIDVPPTVLGLLGLAPHPSFQGTDLFGGHHPRPAYMMAHACARQFAIVKGDWKLTYDEDWRGYALFDLGVDPGERRNLADERPQIVRHLKGDLNAWRKAQLDYYLDPRRFSRGYAPVPLD
jgi:lipoteichoic acid synthase